MSEYQEPWIDDIRTVVLPADSFSRLASGEMATVTTWHLEIGNGIAEVMPFPTTVKLIAASKSTKTYLVSTRGYKVEQLLEVVMAYVRIDLDEAERLINELRPPHVADTVGRRPR